MKRVAVLDDWIGAARESADWSRIEDRCAVSVFSQPVAVEEAASRLAGFEVIVPMRERMAFPASLLAQLPSLKLLALTGFHAPHVDLAYCRQADIAVCGSGAYTPAATAELTLGLMLAALRDLPAADLAVRQGRFQSGLRLGQTIAGQTVGIVGLGRIGSHVAACCKALGAEVVAWSQNLTEAQAEAAGVTRVDKPELFSRADIVSLHLLLSERTRHVVGAAELCAMKPGALLVNTARADLIDEASLLEALGAGRIRAALDVFEQEPLAPDHPLLDLPNTVLSPHLGFTSKAGFAAFYQQTVENIDAWLDGTLLRPLPH